MAGFTPFQNTGKEAMTVTAVFCAALCAGTPSRLAASDNFSVYAPSETAAEQILKQAETHRTEIAKTWFGEKLPLGRGRTLIHVSLKENTDRARSSVLKRGGSKPLRKQNLIWIAVESLESPDFSSLLKHELTHCLLATRYPQGLPIWLHEGIASRCDTGTRQSLHQQTIKHMIASNRFADLHTLMSAKHFAFDDRKAYGLAVSLVDFLLDTKDQETLLEFGADCKNIDNINSALWKHYRIPSTFALQTQWQTWAARQSDVAEIPTEKKLVFR